MYNVRIHNRCFPIEKFVFPNLNIGLNDNIAFMRHLNDVPFVHYGEHVHGFPFKTYTYEDFIFLKSVKLYELKVLSALIIIARISRFLL